MSNKAYEILRMFQSMLLPALGALYVALGNIWGWPYTEAVAATIASVTTFLGCIVAYIRKEYNEKNGIEPINDSEEDDSDD